MNRTFTVHTVSDTHSFLFQSLIGKEALSTPYTLTVDVLAEGPAVDTRQLLGQPMTVECRQTPASPPRFLSGIITRVEARGGIRRTVMIAIPLRSTRPCGTLARGGIVGYGRKKACRKSSPRFCVSMISRLRTA